MTEHVSVALAPVLRQLKRVVVEAAGLSRKRGTSTIAGSVTDSAGQGLFAADVRLLGSGLSTLTDSAGLFEFQSLAAGSYIVRVRREGLASNNYVMQIADDDNRFIQLKLAGLPLRTRAKDVSAASGYGVADFGFNAFDRRTRSRPGTTLLGPGELFRSDGAPLGFVLQRYRDINVQSRSRTASVNDAFQSGNEGDCLLIDGRRAVFQTLNAFTGVRVQIVEVFRANVFVDDWVVSEMSTVRECRGTMERHPPYVVLWTRGM